MREYITVTVTELRKHIGKYLALSQTKDIYITKHGVIIAKLTKGSPNFENTDDPLYTESRNLSDQALSEVVKKGQTDIVCPICRQKPIFRTGYGKTDGMLLGVDGRCSCGFISFGIRT